MKITEWKSIEGFEGLYEVSDFGEVRNARTLKVLKTRNDKDGYQLVTLWKGSPVAKYDRKVHRLVAQAFLVNQESKPTVNHLNGVRNDNRLVNLEWATVSENVKHSYQVSNRPVSNPKPIVAERKGESITFNSVMEAHRAGFNRRGIHNCLNGNYSQHKGYIWRYA